MIVIINVVLFIALVPFLGGVLTTYVRAFKLAKKSGVAEETGKIITVGLFVFFVIMILVVQALNFSIIGINIGEEHGKAKRTFVVKAGTFAATRSFEHENVFLILDSDKNWKVGFIYNVIIDSTDSTLAPQTLMIEVDEAADFKPYFSARYRL